MRASFIIMAIAALGAAPMSVCAAAIETPKTGAVLTTLERACLPLAKGASIKPVAGDLDQTLLLVQVTPTQSS